MNKMRLLRAVWSIVVLLSLSVCWTAAFFITAFIYNYFKIQPTVFFSQLINSLLGFFIFGLGIFILTRIFSRHRQRHMEFIHSITDAMKQIARGNYNVNLEKLSERENQDDPFSEIVDNLNDMAQELGQMEKMRQEFVSNVSHEIQSPLTSISGFARALQNDQLSVEKRIHYLGIIETESRRLSKISDNLLKLTDLESEHHSFEPKLYRLDKQLRQIVLSCEPQWLVKEIEWDLSLEEASLIADKELMDQVWMNLLNNAIKFTPNSGTIGLRISQTQDKVMIEVSDSGIGISEDEQLHLYERFYKADKARNRDKSGSGLGLSIVKKIIDMHGGAVHVTSKLNEGATFTIVLKKELQK